MQAKKSTLVALFLLISLTIPALAESASPVEVPSGQAGRPGSSSESGRTVKDKWAFVVGISKFKKPELNLRYAAKDAKDFYDFLVKEENFAPDHIAILTDEEATRANILSLLGDRWLPRLANPDDLVVLYFSTHGSPADMDVGGINYLLAHDTDPENLFASGLPMQDLLRIIKGRIHSDRIVLILDACHSGSANPEAKGIARAANVDVDEIVQGTGQLVISSSRTNQRSWECAGSPNGVFTRYLIEALRKNGNATTLGEAFEFLKDKVQEHVLRERGVLQTPVLKSKWEGTDLVLAVPPASPRPSLEVHLPQPSPASAGQGNVSSLPADVPRVWHSLEKNSWGTLQGTWVYNQEQQEFDATYASGSSARLKLEEFSAARVALSGRFKGGSLVAPGGQKYTLSGVRQGNKIYGQVVYHHLGMKVKGTWEAWW